MTATSPARQLAFASAELGRGLRSLRQRAGLGGVEAARRAGMSQSKISFLENSRRIPTLEDVHKLCSVYDASGDERDQLVQLAIDVREVSKRTRIVLPRGAAQLQNEFARMETAAVLLRSYCPSIVTGNLQTPDYIRLLYKGELPDDDLEQVVTARADRRRMLDDEKKQFAFILSEGALRWHAGSPRIMANQVDAIIEATRRTNVRIGIIPWTRPVQTFCTHSFDMYDNTAVVVGTQIASATFTDTRDVDVYDQLFVELEAAASFDDEARRELVRIGNDYRMLA